jgi:hypothetical protein
MNATVGWQRPEEHEAVHEWPPSPLDKEYCDACHAPGMPNISRAYVLYQLPSGRLALCHHHANLWGSQLATLGAVIVVDDRERLYPRGAMSSS